MPKAIALAAVLGFFGFLFRYDSLSTGPAAFVVDRWTGSTTIIAADGRSITVDPGRGVTAPILLPITMERHGNATLSLRLKWRSGKLYYDFAIDPLSDELTRVRSSNSLSWYTAHLADSDGFEVAQLPFGLSSMTRIVDAEGNAKSLQHVGSVEMSHDDFAAIGGWQVTWNF